MTEATKKQAPGDGVHRLVDMVVEEVSLVDRAANKHRFLIVKRDDTMDEDMLTEAPGDEVDAPLALDAADEGNTDVPIDSDSPLGAAVEALEQLTEIVELLSALGQNPIGANAGDLAAQLRVTAEALLARIEPSGTDSAPESLELRAPVEPEKRTAAEQLVRAKANVAAAKAKVARPAVPRTKTPAPAAKVEATPELDAMNKGIASLSESLKTLTDLVREQQQRLGRVEKQFGMPNSAPAAERVVKAQPQEVGWPLDLNKPMDRENVDKAVSFHDL